MAAQQAGCFCGNVRMTVAGEGDNVLCHCLDCRKIGGAGFSNNYIIDSTKVTIASGTPKQISKVGDTGNPITSYFCPDCGTTLFRTGDSFPGKHIIKAGIFDDPEWPNKHTPSAELYSPLRLPWIPPVKDAAQLKTMS